jgi:uncharacterized HAD superfamily protein
MKVGFDFDGVIANTGQTVAKVLTNRFGTWIREEDLFLHDFRFQFDLSKEEVKDLVDEIVSYKRTMYTFPAEGCEKVLYKLHIKTEEKITIVTARTDLDVVRQWLNYYLDESIFEVFTKNHGEKGSLLKELNVGLFVEDHLMNAIEIANNGIIPVIFLRSWNKYCFTPRSMINKIGHVVSSWNELEKILL